MDSNEVKKNIEKIRQDKGIKIENICADLNITRQAWYNYLAGGFSLATLNKLAAALHVETYELLKPSEEQTTQIEPTNVNTIICPDCGAIITLNPTTTNDKI